MRTFTLAQIHLEREETLPSMAEKLDFIGQTGCRAIFLLQKIRYFNRLQL
jgi:hypothetical protein